MQDFELKKLKEKNLLFNQFLFERIGIPVDVFEEINRLIEKAYVEKDVRVLKAGDSDINEQVRHLSLKDALDIKAIMKERLGIDFEAVDKLRLKAIEKLLKKGKVRTPEEYELLQNRVDEIYADPNMKEELTRITLLLAAYHKE